MPQITVLLGVVLALVGIVFYLATGAESVTALIPTVFGVVIAVCGVLVIARPTWRKHAMHAAVAIALIGAIAAGGRMIQALAGGGEWNAAIWEQLIMVVLCLVYVGLGVKSFIDARRARQGELPS